MDVDHASDMLTPWLEYRQTDETAVLDNDAPIVVSPSSLQTYLRCPRQFFYQNFLNLRDTRTTPQAALGILTHRLLEVFNRHYPQDYTVVRLKELTEQFFNYETQWPALEAMGFALRDLEAVKPLSRLQQQQIKSQMLQAFSDLAAKGYFQKAFKALHVETTLEARPLGEDVNFVLRGRADLIREHPDGSVEIVDYKTSRRKYTAVKLETNLKPLLSALQPVNWEEPANEKRYNGREYQLPLYWLMAQSNPEFVGKPTHVSVQLVRPPSLSTKTSGCATLPLSHADLEPGLPHLLDLLKKGLYESMQATQSFAAAGHPQKDCKTCAYLHLCEGPQSDMDDMEDWAE